MVKTQLKPWSQHVFTESWGWNEWDETVPTCCWTFGISCVHPNVSDTTVSLFHNQPALLTSRLPLISLLPRLVQCCPFFLSAIYLVVYFPRVIVPTLSFLLWSLNSHSLDCVPVLLGKPSLVSLVSNSRFWHGFPQQWCGESLSNTSHSNTDSSPFQLQSTSSVLANTLLPRKRYVFNNSGMWRFTGILNLTHLFAHLLLQQRRGHCKAFRNTDCRQWNSEPDLNSSHQSQSNSFFTAKRAGEKT